MFSRIWKRRVGGAFTCTYICQFAAVRVCVSVNTGGSVHLQQETHIHSECIPALLFFFKGFSKGWIRLLPANCVRRWKPAELSHGDVGTKAWWIRAAAFSSEPVSDKQSQHRLGCVCGCWRCSYCWLALNTARVLYSVSLLAVFLCRTGWTGM